MAKDMQSRVLGAMESQLNQIARRIERQSESNLEQLQRQWIRQAEAHLQQLLEQVTAESLRGIAPEGGLFGGLSQPGDRPSPASGQDQSAHLASLLQHMQRNR